MRKHFKLSAFDILARMTQIYELVIYAIGSISDRGVCELSYLVKGNQVVFQKCSYFKTSRHKFQFVCL